MYDDGFVVYLNGKEVARRSIAAGTVTYSTLASDNEAGAYEAIDLHPWRSCLVEGTNVLAVEVHQSSPASADLVWDAELAYSTVLPPPDTDGDGIPDDWESANGLNPMDPADANQDPDSDGFTNLKEYLAGTDPQDASSSLELIDITMMTSESHLRWSSVPGKTYRVRYGSDLTNWFGFGISGDITADSAISEFTDPLPSPVRRFYRIDLIEP